eukprot:TRINITY_DN56896_c0_g1_i1.p1 TRINITY_DN56896_c0_g1~~TRINITY_DN56896_c0_g1_i1.p1  ORF type:complete len:468 (+),score=49.05 TRINITY_DN56896_c0_g1_i1:41-1405(+)
MAPIDSDPSPAWVNAILRRMWPTLRKKLNATLNDELVPQMNVALRSGPLDKLATLQVLDCVLGSAAPEVDAIRAFSLKGTALEVAADVTFSSAVDISMYAMGTVLSITSLSVRGELVLQVIPLSEGFPLVEHAVVSFRKSPTVRMDFSSRGSLGLESIVQRIFDTAILQSMVMPKGVLLPIAESWQGPSCVAMSCDESGEKWEPSSVGSVAFLTTGCSACNKVTRGAYALEEMCSSDWIGVILKIFWPKASAAMERPLISTLEPVINHALGSLITNALGSFQISRFSLGKTPPKLSSPRVVDITTACGQEGVEVSFDIEFHSNVQILMTSAAASIGMRRMRLKGELVARMLLSGDGGLVLYLRETPELEIDFQGLSNMADFPGISSILRMAVASAIDGSLVHPNYIDVPISCSALTRSFADYRLLHDYGPLLAGAPCGSAVAAPSWMNTHTHAI